MSLALKFTREAKADVASIVAWYRRENAVIGDRFKRTMAEKITAVRAMPTLYPIVRGTTRRLLLNPFPYDVYYRHGQGEVIVIAILHQHRAPGFILQRLQKH
ncbi:MAG: type II toxin-antitoxin system RelE/ParE family toxin [Rickettsiales bacterium]